MAVALQEELARCIPTYNRMHLKALQGPISNLTEVQGSQGSVHACTTLQSAQPATLPVTFPCCSFNRNGFHSDNVAGAGYDRTRADGPQTSGIMLLKTEATAERSQPLLPVRVVPEITDARG